MVENSDLEINSILDLQLALIEDNNSAIHGYVERLDRETSNDAMRQAGEHFGFPTIEVNGVFYAANQHISPIFGYKTPHGLMQLLKRRGISGINLAGFTHDVCIKIRKTLGLMDNDRKTTLHEWPSFLIGGMNSDNEEAKAVQGYLLRMEKVARIGIVAVKSGQPSPNLPEGVHAMCMTKLATQAWKGNPVASYILEHHYDVPVSQLMHRTDPDMSELAGTIAQYLHFICDDALTAYGLKITGVKNGFAIEGKSRELYTTFLEIARRHNLHRFFGNNLNFGNMLSREADALEVVGWRRSVLPGKRNGYFVYRFEQNRQIAEAQTIEKAD